MPSSAAAGVRQDFCRAALVLGCALAALSCRRTPEEFAPQTSLDSSEELGPQTPTGASASADAGAVPSKPKAAANCPPDPEPNAHALPLTTLTIPDSTSGILTLEAEVAKGDHDTERGLMYRTEMPEMHGMIFELTRDDHAFWMHNTCISLDLLYVDQGQIVGIVESAPTLNDEARRVGKPSDEVLELNAGFCKRHGVKVGGHVRRAVPPSPRAP